MHFPASGMTRLKILQFVQVEAKKQRSSQPALTLGPRASAWIPEEEIEVSELHPRCLRCCRRRQDSLQWLHALNQRTPLPLGVLLKDTILDRTPQVIELTYNPV